MVPGYYPARAEYSAAISRFIYFCLLASNLLFASSPLSARPQSAPEQLQSGLTRDLTLSGESKLLFSIPLIEGQFVYIKADQRGKDIALSLSGPNGEVLIEIDSPNGNEGPEKLYWVAAKSGTYRVSLSSDSSETGRISLSIPVLRQATSVDRARYSSLQYLVNADATIEARKASAYGEALANLKLAIQGFTSSEDMDLLGRANYQAGIINSRLGNRAEAIQFFEASVRTRNRIRDRYGEGSATHNIGVIHLESGDAKLALEALKRALVLRREVSDKIGEASTLNSMGEAYRRIGSRYQALESLQTSLKLQRELKNRTGEATVLNGLGVLYEEMGESSKAIEAYALALPLRKEPALRALTQINLANAYNRLGLPDEALIQLQQALDAAVKQDDKLLQARCWNFIGLANFAQNQYDQALDNFSKALKLYQSLSRPEGELAAISNLGKVYLAKHQLSAALESFQNAYRLAARYGSAADRVHVKRNEAAARFQAGQLKPAQKSYRQALELARSSAEVREVAEALYGLARISAAQARLNPALDYINQAIEIVETVRARLEGSELRSSYRSTVAAYYELKIDLLMRKNLERRGRRLDIDALLVNEGARKQSLVEMLSRPSARIDVPVELSDRAAALQLTLGQKLARAIGTSQIRSSRQLRTEISNIRSSIREVEAEIGRRSRQLESFASPAPASLDVIQGQVLDSETMLLEYSLAERHSYLWAVTSKGVRSFVLPPRKIIESLARKYLASLSSANGSLAAGKSLRTILLSQIPVIPGIKRYLIVADGSLQLVPLGALPDRSGTPLLQSKEVVSIPSVSSLLAVRKRSPEGKSADNSIAIIADPVFDAKDERIVSIKLRPLPEKSGTVASPADLNRILLTKIAKTSLSGAIPRLPGTRVEAEAIAALSTGHPVKIQMDFSADRSFLFGEDIGRFSYLHLATHGFLNPEVPELSGLVFSLVNKAGASVNGLLLSPEVYQLRLPNTELVVLSACETGQGKLLAGEGVVGLTSGFMYAGARRVVVSHWSVSDVATAELMKRFYQKLFKNGLAPAAALRAAQLEMRQIPKWSSPYYWAAFELQGEFK